ncbi:hypothetical protein EHP00_152 [Ecytonucleospora hepatopenaei]|uniref:Uncharacterized protein n=1 Tax=Ecytonucleospora hepatopenaei TaxID=646526 RepID=A0A1W0E6A3_9MICR|nr:hypothetical protein EHP00_152 [Ecytonucleospora hepatopenaei]
MSCFKCYYNNLLVQKNHTSSNKDNSNNKSTSVDLFEKYCCLKKEFTSIGFSNTESIKLKPEIHVKSQSFNKQHFFDFINSFDLHSQSGILTNFDNTKIYKFMINSQKNMLIDQFILRLTTENSQYPKECHSVLCELFIFMYIYCHNNSLEKLEIRKKIEKYYLSFKHNNKYCIQLTNDSYINQFICLLSYGENLKERALKLNWIYVNCKNYRDFFKQRILCELNSIDACFLADFFRTVFTHNLIENISSDKEIYLLLLAFVKKAYKDNDLINAFNLMLCKIDDFNVRNSICDSFLKLNLKIFNDKTILLRYKILLENTKNINEIREIILKPSTTIYFAIEAIHCIYILTKSSCVFQQKNVCIEVLHLVVDIYSHFKNKPHDILSQTYFKTLEIVLEKISKFKEDVFTIESFVDFNITKWNVFSKIILFGVRSKEQQNQITQRSFLKTTQHIILVQEILIERGYKNIVCLKDIGWNINH